MNIRAWLSYTFRDPWDFADPDKVARWPALAAAASGGDVKQAPGEAPQSGGDSRNAQKPIP